MSSVNLFITSAVLSSPYEKRFSSSTTLNELKKNIQLVVGITSENMKLELRDEHGRFLSSLTDEDATLESLNMLSGMAVHVEDITASASLASMDTSAVEKYEMSDDKYSQRADSVRAWKQKEGYGRFAKNSEHDKVDGAHGDDGNSKIAIGNRCRVHGAKERLGTVAYIGSTSFKPGTWIGVRLDEPTGKNDGSVDGTRYFECDKNCGCFVRPQDIEVGDFRELPIEENMDEI